MPNIFRRIWDAIRRPETYAPPPLPPAPPPPPTPRRRLGRRTPSPPVPPPPTRIVSRAELPPDWGRNESSLWQDATKSVPGMGQDRIAQMFYDAALYTRSDTPGDRADAVREFKDYVLREYGIDWDEVFDWGEYRRNYDFAV
jgi:hypothetical protein